MMVPSFEVTCCIAFSFSITVCFGELVAALPASSFLVDEMDRAALEGYRAYQGQREFLRHLPKERHSAPQENRMNRQSALVWRRFAAFKREEPQAQTINLLKHSIEGGLIGKGAG
jgi:hypothetical protein